MCYATKFNLSGPNFQLVIFVTPKANENFRTVSMLLFYILEEYLHKCCTVYHELSPGTTT